MKIIIVIGVRPHFIKASRIISEIKKKHDVVIVHTGQHYDYEMSGVFFEQLNIVEPDYMLAVGSGSPGRQVGVMVTHLEEIFQIEKPDSVFVIGDTNSSLAAALTAALLQLPVIHLEAGLRSGDRLELEEINRKMIDSLSCLYLCPNKIARKNLLREGVSRNDIKIVGEILFDAISAYLPLAHMYSTIVQKLGIEDNTYVLVSVHKPYNIGQLARISSILKAIEGILTTVVWPMHPGTKKAISLLGLDGTLKNISNLVITDPLSYFDMLALEEHCTWIMTDSSGLQREAEFFNKKIIVLRDKTENIQLIDKGIAQLFDPCMPEFQKFICSFARELSPVEPQKFQLVHNKKTVALKIRRALDLFEEESYERNNFLAIRSAETQS